MAVPTRVKRSSRRSMPSHPYTISSRLQAASIRRCFLSLAPSAPRHLRTFPGPVSSPSCDMTCHTDIIPALQLLVTTADHDDRVVPLHSFKYAAQLQYTFEGVAAQTRPLLIRIETKAGHGAGKRCSFTSSLLSSRSLCLFRAHGALFVSSAHTVLSLSLPRTRCSLCLFRAHGASPRRRYTFVPKTFPHDSAPTQASPPPRSLRRLPTFTPLLVIRPRPRASAIEALTPFFASRIWPEQKESRRRVI
jgi:hypothetical protein